MSSDLHSLRLLTSSMVVSEHPTHKQVEEMLWKAIDTTVSTYENRIKQTEELTADAMDVAH